MTERLPSVQLTGEAPSDATLMAELSARILIAAEQLVAEEEEDG